MTGSASIEASARAPRPVVELVAYLALALALCWTAWVTPGALIGGGEEPDWTGTLWAWWWTSHALFEGTLPFEGTHNYFPVGQAPVAQFNLVDGLLAAPFLALLGPIAGLNAFCVVSLVLNGLCARALAGSAGAERAGAFLAGAAVLSCPFVFFELSQGRPSQAWLAFWLLGLRGLWRLSRGEGDRKEAVVTGVLVALSSLTYWYYGLFLCFAAVPLWLAALPRVIRERDGGSLGLLGLAAATTALVLSPFLWALTSAYGDLPGVGRAVEPWMMSGRWGRGDFSLSMALRHGHWWGWPLWHVDADQFDKRLPLGLLGLASLGLVLGRGRRLPWLGMVSLGWVLSLGPWWKQASGQPVDRSLPYLWLYDTLPFFDRLWWPDRFELLVVVGLSMLAGLGLSRLATTLPLPRWAVAGAGLGLLLADERWRHSWAPVKAEPVREVDADFYALVDGPVLSTPVVGPSESGRYALWAQLFHDQPVLAGLGDHLPGHRPPEFDAWLQTRPLLVSLANLSEDRLPPTSVQPEQVQQLVDDGFVWFVVDPMIYAPSYESAWASTFTRLAEALWGEPELVGSSGAKAWRITVPAETVELPALGPVEPRRPR